MKLTSSMLRRIIREEVAKFGDMEATEDRADDTEELDADEFGSEKALAKPVDMLAALKIEENRLRRRLHQIAETKRRLSRRI